MLVCLFWLRVNCKLDLGHRNSSYDEELCKWNFWNFTPVGYMLPLHLFCITVSFKGKERVSNFTLSLLVNLPTSQELWFSLYNIILWATSLSSIYSRSKKLYKLLGSSKRGLWESYINFRDQPSANRVSQARGFMFGGLEASGSQLSNTFERSTNFRVL